MTSVPPSATPPAVSLEGSNESFATSPRERVGSVVLIFLVAALTVVMFTTSNNVVDNLKVISDSGSTTYNMAITQRESLVFTVAFDQWLSGTITRRELQIRRALLAQRLVVRDNTGVTNGSRVRAEYFEALGELDGYTWEALPGYLPPDSQASLRSKSADALEQFNFESRELSVRISQSSDRQTRQLIAEENSSRTGRYVSVLVILGLMAIVFGFLDVARRRNHRLVRARARNERRELEELRTELKQVDDELQSRLERERIMRAENNWLDSTIRSITLQFKSTFESEQIAEFLAEGLGRELNADSVICYSFDEVLWPGFVKQWHRGSDISFDESLLVKHESTLSDMVHDLWSRRDVIIVEDSQLIDLSQRPIPEVAAITKELARSWVIAPVADGSRVLGFVFIMMTSDVRAWSSTEIALIQTVSSDAASVCIHARMFRQSMQIAENDAEVNRLVELDRVKNDFIENMNHELRTPLTSIIGYLEVIMDDVDVESEPELVSSLVAVQRNALRLQILIENMMQISKTDFEHVPLVASTVNVGQLLGDVVNSLKLGGDESGVAMTLGLDSSSRDLIIDGDVNQLEQVFVNLMSNALKFTPRGGTVTVSARRVLADGDYVEVQVADTGIGIPAQEFPNVFKRFFRASTATQASIPGFGIGLSLVHSIVREHHGTITFDSTVGKGTVFTVKLPVRLISKTASDVMT